jgi:hypothetical protein
VDPEMLHFVASVVLNDIDPEEAPEDVATAYVVPPTRAFVGAVEVIETVALNELKVKVKLELVIELWFPSPGFVALIKHEPAVLAVRVADAVASLKEQPVAVPPETIAKVGTPLPVPPEVLKVGVALKAVPE